MHRFALILSIAAIPAICADAFRIDDIYRKQDTWRDTLRVSLRNLVAWEKAHAKAGAAGAGAAGFELLEQQQGIGLSRWKTLPPFKAQKDALGHDYGPESSLETQKWLEKPKWRAGYVIKMGMPGSTIQYCYCRLQADADRTVTAYMGSDDGIAVFLNGAKLLANDARRGVGANQETVKLALKKGVNHLLLKIHNAGGDSGMYFSLEKEAKGSLSSSTKGISLEDSRRTAIWARLTKDFGADPVRAREMKAERQDGIWAGDLGKNELGTLAQRYAANTRPYEELDKKAKGLVASVKDAASLQKLRDVYYESLALHAIFGPKDPAAPNNGLPPCLPPEQNDGVLNGPLTKGGHSAKGEGDQESLRLAIEDLINTHGDKYPNGKSYLERLKTVKPGSEEFLALKREALLANPLLDFDKVLMVRSKKGKRFAANWETRTSCGGTFEDELVVLSLRTGETKTVYKPGAGKYVGDIDLHWDGGRVLFSSHVDKGKLTDVPGTKSTRHYSIFEVDIDPKSGAMKGDVRQVAPDMGHDVDNYYACYLPDDRIVFASTAAYDGVPCVGGGAYVANLYLMNGDGSGVRRLTFDQDASWHPSVRSDGRVMYVRWEYTDSAHYYSRVVMTMNPDGTDQKAYYGSNSYWPNSLFFPRQIPGPGNSTKFVATVTGHHSHAKGGAACIFDVSRGREEADGAVQFLTGRGKKVEPLVIDNLCRVYNPKFYEPFPLSEKYFLIVANASIYLVDTFDNMLCLKQKDGSGGYWEPIPLRKAERPPVVADRVDSRRKHTTVILNDVYQGPGLAGVPRGTVKAVRVYRYEYGPRHKGGHYAMGMEAGWDAKQILGTAPVKPDGSASFMVPANTPFAVQPLDADGKALQLMRSWVVGMPGELLSCVGCHESQNLPPTLYRTKAMLQKPDKLKPFHGSARGFSFTREIQPVLDKFCVGCHDGTSDLAADGRDKKGRYIVPDRIIGTGSNTGKKLRQCGIPDLSKPSSAHRMLHPYVRRNGPEGDYHLLTPLEFHADTSELVQMLRKGHHNVELDAESWDRLITWIDLNAPYHGTWTEAGAKAEILERRLALRKLYANDTYNPETVVNPYQKSTDRVMPAARERQVVERKPAAIAKQEQTALELGLGDDVTMRLVSIPAGSFSMGSNDETPVEQPVTRVTIAKPFYMGATEVTLKQYRQFDPGYLNGVYDMHYKDQVHRGYYMNHMPLPAIRVTWERAMAFCEWLSAKTGRAVTLPTEAQWEWACRAGTDTPLSYGNLDTIFSEQANMADVTVKLMAVSGVNPRPIKNPNTSMDFKLKDPRSDDNTLFLASAGTFLPNAWGLHDMHGNAAEWTRSAYRPYPYNEADGRNEGDSSTHKVVRGGSWHDRPFRCTSSYRLGFPAWQRVYNVGFRVVCE